MFSWICPKCGKEVPPSHLECPFCAPAAPTPARPPAAAATNPVAPSAVPASPLSSGTAMLGAIPTSTFQMAGMPKATVAPPAPAMAQPVAAAPPTPFAEAPAAAPAAAIPPPPPMLTPAPSNRLPNWAGALIAFALVGAIAGSVAWYTTKDSSSPAAAATAPTAGGAKPGTVGSHPYSKDLEVAGFRITMLTKAKAQVQFLVINHGGSEMSDLGGTIRLNIKGAKPEDEPAAVFKFKVSSIPPFGVKEVEVSDFVSKRKPIDMPDWQFMEPVVEISSPEP